MLSFPYGPHTVRLGLLCGLLIPRSRFYFCMLYRFHYRFLQIACVCHWQRHSGFKDKTGAVADDFMYYKESVGFNKNSN